MAIASILLQQTNRSGDIVARYGDDEFILLFPETDHDAIEIIAERTLQAIQNAKMDHSKSEIGGHLTISVGVASCTECDDNTADELMKSAEVALYFAKHNGRNQWRMAEQYGQVH